MAQHLPTEKNDFYLKALKLSLFSMVIFPIVGQIVTLGLLWQGYRSPGKATTKSSWMAIGAILFVLAYVLGLAVFYSAYRQELFRI